MRILSTDENSLNKHYKQYHSTVSCDICSEIVLEAMLDKHIKAHDTLKTFKSGLAKGKVRAKRIDRCERKKRGMTGFNIYCKENMSVIKTKNPYE